MKAFTLLALASLSSVAVASVEVYYQCGGSAYTGETECESGSTCTYVNEWYSQCIPSSDDASSTPTYDSGEPESTPSYGGSDPDSTPSYGGSDPDSTPAFGGDEPESTPGFY